jgi:hypothetical protein
MKFGLKPKDPGRGRSATGEKPDGDGDEISKTEPRALGMGAAPDPRSRKPLLIEIECPRDGSRMFGDQV